MIKVLVAEENVAEANKYCRYLSKCRDLKIKTVNSGDQALSTYLKIKPNIFILDSHFNDINSTEIIDRLSITYNEGNNSNILLTANSAEEQVTFVNVSKIYKFFKKPVKLRNLYNTISQMNEKYKYDDFNENEMNVLLRELGFVINSPCTDLMIEAITECYHFTYLIHDLKSLFEILSYHHKDMDEEAIRSSLRTSLKPLNRKRHILQNHPIVMQFEQGKNISPGRFLDVFLISLQIYSPSVYGKFISNNIKSAFSSKISSTALSNFCNITESYPFLSKNIFNSLLNFSSSSTISIFDIFFSPTTHIIAYLFLFFYKCKSI